jgi:hypothetical protein
MLFLVLKQLRNHKTDKWDSLEAVMVTKTFNGRESLLIQGFINIFTSAKPFQENVTGKNNGMNLSCLIFVWFASTLYQTLGAFFCQLLYF